MRALLVPCVALALMAQPAVGQFAWRQTAGPSGGSVLSMVRDQHGRMLAGCAFGGIYRIAPNGNEWIRMNAGMSDRDIAALARSPVDGAIYAGSRGRALFVSRDDGETWARTTGQPASTEVVSLLVRSNGDVVVGTFGGGVFISTDAGGSWTEANDGLVTTGRKRVTALVERNAVLFAATGGGIMEFTAAGWSKREAGLPDSTVYDLYATAGGDLLTGIGFNGVWRSTDAGQSWQPVGTETFAARRIGESPAGTLLAGDFNGGVRKFGASGWSGPDALPMVNAFLGAGDSLFAAVEGGIFRTRDDGATWRQVNNGLANAWVLSLAVPEAGPVFAGTAHNGIMRLPFAGSDWFQADVPPQPVSPVLGMAISDAGHLYAATQYRGLWKSTDNGASWTSATTAPLPGGLRAVVAGGGELVFAGSNFGGSSSGVYVSTDAGASWTKRVAGIEGQMIQSLAYDRARDILYAGTYGGGAFLSTDRGQTWDPSGSSNAYVMAIAVARNTGEVFVAGGSGGGQVYRSVDAGRTWLLDSVPTWRNVLALAYDDTREILYAGTFLDGVFRKSTSGAAAWEKINDGLPNLQVEALAIDTLSGVVYAGVRGDGVVAGFPSPPSVLTRTRRNLSLPIADPGEVLDATTLVAGSGPGKLAAEAVTDLVVRIDEIRHPMVGELTVTLEHGGVEVELVSGLAGADLLGLVLSDTAARTLPLGSAPYTGSFRPRSPLSAFAGLQAGGLWSLIVRDGTPGNAGTLNAWGLTVTVGSATAVGDEADVPGTITLAQNYPNPFNPSTTITYALPVAGMAAVDIFDMLGRRVATVVREHQAAGTHRVGVDGSRLASGVYVYRLSAAGQVLSRRMLLLK